MEHEQRQTPDESADSALVYSLYQQGQTHLATGNARSAAEVLELAVEHEPSKASLHEALGRAYFASQRPQLAREEFERALELEPTNHYAHFGAGRCYERENRLPDAAKHFKLACAMADRDPYRRALARVQERLDA